VRRECTCGAGGVGGRENRAGDVTFSKTRGKFMAKFLAAALAFAGALLLTPVASAQTISAPLRVATGDAFTVNVAYTQSSEIADEPIEVTMHYLYAVHVLDAEQRLWRFTPISISYDIPDMPGFDSEEARNIHWPAMSEMMSALMRIGTDVGF